MPGRYETCREYASVIVSAERARRDQRGRYLHIHRQPESSGHAAVPHNFDNRQCDVGFH